MAALLLAVMSGDWTDMPETGRVPVPSFVINGEDNWKRASDLRRKLAAEEERVRVFHVSVAGIREDTKAWMDDDEYEKALERWVRLFEDGEKTDLPRAELDICSQEIGRIRCAWIQRAEELAEEVLARARVAMDKGRYKEVLCILSNFPDRWAGLPGLEVLSRPIVHMRHHAGYHKARSERK